MLFRDIIYLVSSTPSTNDIGDAVQTLTEREVFANKKSVQRSEFYQAAATGLRPETVFEVRTMEYDGQATVRHGERTYSVIRTYDTPGELTEIVCSGMVNK